MKLFGMALCFTLQADAQEAEQTCVFGDCRQISKQSHPTLSGVPMWKLLKYERHDLYTVKSWLFAFFCHSH